MDRRILSILKHVPHAANGMDQFLFEWIVDLAAQPAYRHIDDVGIAVEIDVPTCSAISVRDKTSPSRRISSERSANSLEVRSRRLPLRVALWRPGIDLQVGDFQVSLCRDRRAPQ